MTIHWHVQYGKGETSRITPHLVDVLAWAERELEVHAERAQATAILVYKNLRDYEKTRAQLRNAKRYAGLEEAAFDLGRSSLYRQEYRQSPEWQQAAQILIEEINVEGPEGFRIWACRDDYEIEEK